jgi:microcompartment protein CcmK/EutM
VDLVGAGEDELVMVSEGSSARMAIGSDRSPADAAIIGILDSLRYYGDLVYRKA